MRSAIILSLPLLLSAGMLAAVGDTDTQEVSFDKPVQIPEAVLQPGKYQIQLEDHLSDRAIVRITEPGGTMHYVLTVPSKNLNAATKGITYFPDAANNQVIEGWECGACKQPLEFVYPKDEAVKLTAETGKPILAYDPSYDKLPANLTADDRKVVTLWLLSPKTVTAQGTGEGLTAAKLKGQSQPKMIAANQPLPNRMPKTSTNAYTEIACGLLSFTVAFFLFLRRKVTD